MSKRRTREQKIKVQNKTQTNPIRYIYDVKATTEVPVKSYFEDHKKSIHHNKAGRDISESMGNLVNLKLIKRDLIKSLSIASFILCLEIVLYLLWYK